MIERSNSSLSMSSFQSRVKRGLTSAQKVKITVVLLVISLPSLIWHKLNNDCAYQISHNRDRLLSSRALQDDECLIHLIRDEMLEVCDGNPPTAINITDSKTVKIFEVVDELLERKTGGYFVECGAHDGLVGSLTLPFEVKRNFSGLLVEANPKTFAELRKTRHAKALHACLSPRSHPERSDFISRTNQSGQRTRVDRVQCLPLYSMILAVGNPVIDLLSLDIGGVELEVIKSFPWDKVDVKVIRMEYGRIGVNPIQLVTTIQEYLLEKRFELKKELGQELVFAKM